MRDLELPDPARAATLDELVERLRLLKVWGGDPSYEMINERVNVAWRQAGPIAGGRAPCERPGAARSHDTGARQEAASGDAKPEAR